MTNEALFRNRDIDPESIEIVEGPEQDLNINRRDFWKLLGAGTLLIVTEPSCAAPEAELLSTRFHVADDGAVTLLCGKVEIGQGARTELTQVVAEELRVDPARVNVILADTRLVPDDGGTYASLTTPRNVPVIRRAAARARQLLPALKKGEQLPGEAPDEIEVTDPKDWKVCGTSLPRVGAREIVTGRHKYAADFKAPGMLYAKVLRAPAYKAELMSCDTSAAAEMPGVTAVRDGNFAGVAAPTRQAAEKALRKIKAEWKTQDLTPVSELFSHYKKTAEEPVLRSGSRYPALLEAGSVEQGMKQASVRVEASYTVKFIAHAPLEPRAALAEWTDDGLTVRVPTQVPFGVHSELAREFSLPEEKVRVIVPEVGSGFGGRHRGDCAVEAARLAKAAGKPVLLEWTREEEFTCAYLRPAGLIEAAAGAAKDGKVTAWEFHNYNSGSAGLPPPYGFPNHYCAYHQTGTPFRQGPYRALSATANAFAREMQMTALATKLGMDQVEFRLKNIIDSRLREVVERAADKFGWGKTGPGKGRGVGVACNIEKAGRLAQFVELESDGKTARILRTVIAFDCGAIINPGNLRNQITGAVIQGIGGALFEELTYDSRKITNPAFSGYRVPRFSDVPPIEVVLVNQLGEKSVGAGESPITGIAPAIGAALHNATGQWFRALPMMPG